MSKHGFDSTRFELWQNNWITSQDPGFVNPDQQNFNLKEDAAVFEEIPGFEPIPYSDIGLYEDQYRDDL